MNIHAIRDHLVELNYIHRTEFRSNGQEAIDCVKELVQSAIRRN